MGPMLEAFEELAERSIKAYSALHDEPDSHSHYAELEVDTHMVKGTTSKETSWVL